MEPYYTKIIMLIVLVLLSGFFSATETAFSSLNKIRLKNLANNGSTRAKKTLELADNYSSLITTILVGNNIVNILSASLAAALFIDILGEESGIGVSTLVMTLVVLIFGEITPKNIAKEIAETYAMAVTPIMNLLMILLTPIVFIFNLWKIMLNRLFNFTKDEGVTSDELVTIIEEAEAEGDLKEHESDLIVAAIEFSDLEVKEILTPRVDVVAINKETPIDEIKNVFKENSFSRLPVYDGTIDNIVGIVHEKDFYHLYYTKDNADIDINSIIKDIIFTNPNIKVASLLKLLQASKSHIAVVIDEYGGTLGIITMEDILEELVGEIYDEHDEVEENYQRIDDNTILVECDSDVEDLFEYLGLKEIDEYEFNTVSGWIIHMLDRMPKINDTFDYKNYTIIITDADNKKAIQAKVITNNIDNISEE